MNKFSILIPCYNADRYLERCLNSIVNQTYQNFEIIIVNDGSIDKSSEIIEKYLKIYNNIKCLNQTNQGVAVARNNAIKNIRGNYFIFVDADDIINPELLFKLNEYLNINAVDIVRYNGTCTDINNNTSLKYICPIFNIMSGKDVLKFFVENGVRYGPLWLYCYNTDFYKKNNFQFYEGKLHEDFYNIYILSMAEKVGYIDYIGYNYIKNIYGITSAKNYENEAKRIKDILYVFDRVVAELNKQFKNKEDDFYFIYRDLIKFLDVGLKTLNEKQKEEYLQKIFLRKKWEHGNNG